MKEHEFGTIVTSIAGHDKNKHFILLKTDSNYGYLVDGKSRTLKNPKKKNLKHIQFTSNKVLDIYDEEKKHIIVTNEQIKRAIKIYNRNKCSKDLDGK